MTDHDSRRVVTAAETDHGLRIDAVIARALPDISRSRVKGLIRAGHVRIGGRTIGDANSRVKYGDEIEVVVPVPADPVPKGETIALDVVYEDEHVIVIDKPAGLVVHPAAGHSEGTLVNALIAHCGDSLSGIGGVRRPGIVHRLDKDTSGLLVVAKTDAAHQGLSEQFAAHGRDGRLSRSYRAFCWRVPERSSGTIDAPLGRAPKNRTRIAVRHGADARNAVTHYQVIEIFARRADETAFAIRPTATGSNRGRSGALVKPPATLVAALLRIELETGRTHQIRVHLAHIGHPILGDSTYGAGFKASAHLLTEAAAAALLELGRQALHAAELGFIHPVTGERLHFESALPDDMARLAAALRGEPVGS